ncbi:MAG: hypothetical protein ACHQ1H_08575 [Nitrososphaerales archaeon]
MAENQLIRNRGESIIDRLLHSTDPSIVFRTRVEILGESPISKTVKEIQKQVSRSDRVRSLLSERREDGTLPWHPYSKWCGAHWMLSSLADLCYPSGDKSLVPLREQVYGWLFSKAHLEHIRKRHELVRAHASMEGNAIYYLAKLGLSDDRTRALADLLVDWQWPDGGWNCDQTSTAHTSSFTESLWPLRGLFHFSSISAKRSYWDVIESAAKYFLKRKLYKRLTNGRIIDEKFTKLHYPCYWHYDILFGLKVIKEVGRIKDERCSEAISLLKSKRQDDGGFPSEAAYCRVFKSRRSTGGRSLVSWGGVSRERMNEFVTVDALSVLRAAGG